MSPSPSDGSARQRVARFLRAVRVARPQRDDRPHLPGHVLLGYWEQTLNDARRSAVDEHVADCAVCRGWLDEVGRLFRPDVEP
jgi:predicted anti-sigma-YlaC factor YlaD